MGWLFRCLYVISESDTLIDVAFAAILIWLLVRLILAKRAAAFALRDWFGALSLLAGTCSWALFAFFYVYFVVEHTVIFSGSVYSEFTFNIVGSSTAITGVVLALLARGWMRRSGLLVSLVMGFQWLGLWFVVDVGLHQWITILTFALLVAWVGISIANRYLLRGSPITSIQQQE